MDVRARAHTHIPEARSPDLLTDMPVKGKLSCLDPTKIPENAELLAFLHLAWEEMDKGPGAACS